MTKRMAPGRREPAPSEPQAKGDVRHPPRPLPEDRIDYEALHKKAMRQFPKIRAHLAE
ncbi:MAG TPA: hypothetical protein VEA41_20965 [Salinarimonas sp.]|nr:hypothetical protein [Salinarimonas sp.]